VAKVGVARVEGLEAADLAAARAAADLAVAMEEEATVAA